MRHSLTTSWNELDKKRTNQNCRSTDPNDCLAWCKIELKEHRLQFYFVEDISTTSEFITRRLLKYNGAIDKAQHQMKKVLCPDRVPELMQQIKDRLMDQGYYLEGSPEQEKDSDYVRLQIEHGLRLYQIDKRMCVTTYALDALNSLGVSFKSDV